MNTTFTVNQVAEDSAELTIQTTTTQTVNLNDCSFNIFRSDPSTPAELAGFYCTVTSQAGTHTFKVDFGPDQPQFEADLQALFALYLQKIATQ